MAANTAEMQAEESALIGAAGRHDRSREQCAIGYGVIAAAVLVVLLIAGMMIHDRQAKPAAITAQANGATGCNDAIVCAQAPTPTQIAPPLLAAYCDATAALAPACFYPQPEQGVVLKAERQPDGTWQVVAAREMPVDDDR